MRAAQLDHVYVSLSQTYFAQTGSMQTVSDSMWGWRICASLKLIQMTEKEGNDAHI